MGCYCPQQELGALQPIPHDLVQSVRVLDVVAIGPAMIYAGTMCKLPPVVGWFLLISGIGTMVFNGYSLIQGSGRL